MARKREQEASMPVEVQSAIAPESDSEDFYRIVRAPKPLGSYFVVERVAVLNGRVVQRSVSSDPDVYSLTESKLLRVARAPEAE